MNEVQAIAFLNKLTDAQLLTLRCSVKVKACGSLTHGEERQAAILLLPFIDELMTSKGLSY